MRTTVHEVGDNPIITTGARVGYAASGVLHLLIAWIALQMAWTQTSEDADQTGALAAISGTPIGSAVLWVLFAGFALLALWQLTEAIGRHDGKAKAKAAAKAVVYAVLAWTTVTVVQGSAAGGSEQATSTTARLMEAAYGRILVGLIGLAVIGVGVYHVIKGWRRTFLEDLREHPGQAIVRAGQIGYIAKGAALGLVGGLFVAAAVTADPEKASGLDGALRTLLDVPLGKFLLTPIAVGFAAYGAYSFVRARYARV
jgi:hypothetical protein